MDQFPLSEDPDDGTGYITLPSTDSTSTMQQGSRIYPNSRVTEQSEDTGMRVSPQYSARSATLAVDDAEEVQEDENRQGSSHNMSFLSQPATAVPDSAQTHATSSRTEQSTNENTDWSASESTVIVSLERRPKEDTLVLGRVTLEGVMTTRSLFTAIKDRVDDLELHESGETIARVHVKLLSGPTGTTPTTSSIMGPKSIESDRSWDMLLKRCQHSCHTPKNGGILELEATVVMKGGA
jgi:hypothetical protein